MNKIIVALVVFAATVMMSASVIAGATPGNAGTPVNPPTSKEQCKNGGWKNFKDASGNQVFKNQGQCVSWVMAHGNGYGGGGNHGPVINIGNIIINIINSFASTINVVINFIFNFH